MNDTHQDESDLETAHCTLCAKVPSPGFYTGCMIRDGVNKGHGWSCDGNGNLRRPKALNEQEKN